MLRSVHVVLMATVCIAAIVLLFLTFVLVFVTEPDRFVWVKDSSDDVACSPVILDEPAIGLVTVAEFARDAVIEINSYDYLNWDTVIPAALNAYFAPAAARNYMRGFERSRLLANVRDSYFTVAAIATRPPMVVSTYTISGRRAWDVQIPVQIFYQTGAVTLAGGETQRTQNEVFTVTVVEQAPSRESFRGVAVDGITTTRVRVVDDLDRING